MALQKTTSHVSSFFFLYMINADIDLCMYTFVLFNGATLSTFMVFFTMILTYYL